MRIFVIEDHFMFRKRIIEQLKAISPYPFSFIEVTNEREFFLAIEGLTIQDSDLFIIDIDLNYYLTGIDLAEKIRAKNKSCSIVFSTSFDDKITEIVNRQILPLGYLVKNKNSELFTAELTNLIQKVLIRIKEQDSSIQKLILDRGNEKLILNEKEILFIATVPSQKNLLSIHCLDQELLVPGKLRAVKAALNSPYFIKNLKSFVLNTNEIAKIFPLEGLVEFSNQLTLDIGTAGARKVQSFLKEQKTYDTD